MGTRARPESQREHPRVDYAADVRLARGDQQGGGGGRDIDFGVILGRSLNLGPSGILVRSEERCAVGTIVTCEVALPGGPRQLQGSVVRVQPLPGDAVGLGIRFLDLADADRAVLAEVVAQGGDPARLVQVRFEGLSEPVRARAVMTGDGLRLSTALGFLRLASRVDVAVTGEALHMSSQGVLRDVQLEPQHPDGIPRLVVDVGLAAAAPPLIAAGDGQGDDGDGGEGAEDGPDAEDDRQGSPVDQAEAVPSPPAGKGRIRVRVRKARRAGMRTVEPRRASAPAASAAIEAIAAPGVAPQVPTPVPARPRAPAARRGPTFTQVAAVLGSALVTGGLVAWALTIANHRSVASASEPAPTAEPSPAAERPRAEPVRAAVAPSSSLLAVTEERDSPAPLLIPRPLPTGTPGPGITRDGTHATARVPLIGSTAGMFAYSLTHPRGVAVNFPHAQAALPIGLHLVRHDGFRTVWIRNRPEGGVQIRFGFTRRPSPEEQALEVAPDAVTVRVSLPAGSPSPEAAPEVASPEAAPEVAAPEVAAPEVAAPEAPSLDAPPRAASARE